MYSFAKRSVAVLFIWLSFAGYAAAGSTVTGPLATEGLRPAMPAAAQANWPATYYDIADSLFNPREQTIGTSNVSSLAPLWNDGVPGGVLAQALDSGVLFAQAQGPSGAGLLAALDASTGAQYWSTPLGTGGLLYPYSSITVAGGNVFSACGFRDSGNNAYGALCAFSMKTGKLRWNVNLHCNCLPEAQVDTPPAYIGGVVYVGLSPGGCCGGTGIYAIDAKTGTIIWGYVFAGGNGSGIANPLVVGSTHVYSSCEITYKTYICANDRSSGAFVWSYPLITNGAQLTLAKGVVYVHDGAAVTALDGSTGATIWKYADPDGSNGYGPVAIAKGKLYVTGSKHLFALQAKNGAPIWSAAPVGVSSPSVANGVVYETNGDDGGGGHYSVRAFDAGTGALLWIGPNGGTPFNPPPIIANGRLYVGSETACEPCAYALPSFLRIRSPSKLSRMSS